MFQAAGSPLNSVGRQQAEKIAKRVSKLEFETLVSSPLPRAKETAEIVANATNHKTELCDLFVERIKPAGISGKPYTDEKASKTWRDWEKSLSTPGLKVQDGENFEEITRRASDALAWLENRTEKSIVVVTHGYFLRVIIAKVLLGNNLTPEISGSFHRIAMMENTGLSIIKLSNAFEEDYAWRLWTYNDMAHLAV